MELNELGKEDRCWSDEIWELLLEAWNPTCPVDNQRRAAWAAEALDLFASHTGIQGEHPATVFGDFLADAMHLADQLGLDFDEQLEKGRYHYEAEVEEEREQAEAEEEEEA